MEPRAGLDSVEKKSVCPCQEFSLVTILKEHHSFIYFPEFLSSEIKYILYLIS